MSSAVQADFGVDRHGELPVEPEQPAVINNNNPTVQAAYAFAKPLLEKFASGELADKKELQEARNAKYIAEGVPKPKPIAGGAGRT